MTGLLPLLLLLAAPARAGHVDASLLSARAAAAPGESFAAGLRLRHLRRERASLEERYLEIAGGGPAA